jgi:hypothetical protein
LDTRLHKSRMLAAAESMAEAHHAAPGNLSNLLRSAPQPASALGSKLTNGESELYGAACDRSKLGLKRRRHGAGGSSPASAERSC